MENVPAVSEDAIKKAQAMLEQDLKELKKWENFAKAQDAMFVGTFILSAFESLSSGGRFSLDGQEFSGDMRFGFRSDLNISFRTLATSCFRTKR